MGQIVDLTGQRFGKLIALYYAPLKGTSAWACQCDCGNITSVYTQNLCTGNTKSCGCLRTAHRKSQTKNLQGKQFGRLVVIEQTVNNHKGKTQWVCQCECGTKTIVAAASLLRKNTKSCGCLQRDTIRKIRTTHGKSRTKDYYSWHNRRRKKLRKELDFKWVYEMDDMLKIFFRSCVLCGNTENLEIDHVQPLSKGFGLEPGNAVILCKSCNCSKNNYLLNELPKPKQELLLDAAKRFEYRWSQKDRVLHIFDPINYGWSSNFTTYKWRQYLKKALLKQREYKSDFSRKPLKTCHMHEGIVTRANVPKNIWWQFLIFHPFNSFLLLEEEHIPNPPTREWAITNAYERYGKENVQTWFYLLPWKVVPFHFQPDDQSATPLPDIQVADNQIFLYGEINQSTTVEVIKALQYLNADLYKEYRLRMLGEVPPIWLRINSNGGDLHSAFAIVDQINQLEVPVYSLVEGLAASAATVISIACTKRFIRPNAYMMVHQFSGALYGTYEEFKEEVRVQDMLFEAYCNHYTHNSALSVEDLKEQFKQDWWLSAEDAKLVGFVDEIK